REYPAVALASSRSLLTPRKKSVLRVRHLPCRLRISPPPCGGYCPWVRPELSDCVLTPTGISPESLNPLYRRSVHALHDLALRGMAQGILDALAEDHRITGD